VVSSHVSDRVALESPRRRLTPKQADTIARLSAATLTVLRREGFSGLTVRLVAAEAGVGAATAYTYFSSKEHLVAEVFWRRLAAPPPPAHETGDAAPRGGGVRCPTPVFVAPEPPVARARPHPLFGKGPDASRPRPRA